MSERPKALVALGEELDRATARTLTANMQGGLRLPRASGRLSVLAIVIGLLILAAAATAAVLLIGQGSPLPAPHAQDLRSSGIPLPGSARLAGLDAPDPDGSNPPWDLRLSRTASGETCTAVGQVLDGRFGIVGLDHQFRELPLGSVDSCGIDSASGPAMVGARTFIGAATGAARTVLSGVAGAGTRSVIAYAQGGSRELQLGPDGSFITVYGGEAESVHPAVRIVGRDGHARSIYLEQGAPGELSDPGGGSGWLASAEADLQPGASPDETCVQVTRQPSQSEPSHVTLPLTPEICGRLRSSTLFVQMRRFIPGEEKGPFPWGNNPSRTIVYGVASPRVRSLELTGADAVQTVPINRHGGAFAAILDGRIDPRALVLTAKLTDGTSSVYRHPSTLYSAMSNTVIAPTPVPAYRRPRPVSATLPPPFQLPISSTVRETLRSRDPAGGPEWVVRSWQANPNSHVSGAGRARFFCETLGVIWNGRLVAPSARPSDYSEPVEREGRCDSAAELKRLRYSLSLESFLDDPYAYRPMPSRAVLSGILPPGARDPQLLGVGPTRPLTVDANNAFLVILPGTDWNATPRITYLFDGHRVGRVNNPPERIYQPGTEPKIPQVRAPDPDGGAPWGFTTTRRCSTAVGRIVDGRLATIDPLNGVLQLGSAFSGGSIMCLDHPSELEPAAVRNEPVEFDQQQVSSGQSPFSSEPGRIGQPEIERRTLPGRTVITGVARRDVASVTIATPSEVRTLRPTGPLHTLLAVYAGYFLRGSIVASVRLNDGRMVTETLDSPFGRPQQAPTLSEMLADARRQLNVLSQGAERFGGARTLSAYRRRIAQIERRLAYARAHPNVLPTE
ncbi:MAG TPA: hypothetical protein VH061_14225 [Solirubrobacteraceae bacterium]|nr:hypothetical protein [Solirubrobacteraceae bacterium]